MLLLHVSTPRIYSSTVLVAILLLLIPESSSWDFNNPVSYTYGWPRHGDMKTARSIKLAASSRGSATYRTKLSLRWEIHSIRFMDNIRNGPKVSLSRWPPTFYTEVTIIAPWQQEIDFTMEVYYGGNGGPQ